MLKIVVFEQVRLEVGVAESVPSFWRHVGFGTNKERNGGDEKGGHGSKLVPGGGC